MQTQLQSAKSVKGDEMKTNTEIGRVTQVIGPTVDIRFKPNHLPNILDAIRIKAGKDEISVEAAQHLGNNVVRCVALSSTDGIVRGMEAVNT